MGFRIITNEQVEWLVENYHSMLTADCAKHLGLNLVQVKNLAKRLKLKKDKDVISQTNRMNAIEGFKKYIGGNKRNYGFATNVKNIERFGSEVEARRIRNSTETMKAIRKAERRRILFGLPQKTNLKLCSGGRKRSKMRGNLRKWGYDVSWGSNMAYITPLTKRQPELERKYFGIKFIVKNM